MLSLKQWFFPVLMTATLAACGSDDNADDAVDPSGSANSTTDGNTTDSTGNSGNGNSGADGSSQDSPLTAALKKALPKNTSVFGISIHASNQVSDSKVLHAAQIMAQYLDNNEDGTPDNQAVVNQLVKSKATLIMAADENELETVFQSIPKEAANEQALDNIQDLQGSETLPNGAANGQFDGSLEEVLHLITHVGYAKVYPGVFGESTGSAIADAMDTARGGRHLTVPSQYPAGAWYTYDDESCDYSCMVTEYTYWALTSILGGQEFKGRKEQINNEWQLNTKALVQSKDGAVYRILTDTQYGLPSKLPNGNYKAKTFKITNTGQ